VTRTLKRVSALFVVLAAGALVLAACSSSPSSSSTTTAPSGGTKILGGTVKWGEPPSAIPNYIFPFQSLKYFSVTNDQEFEYMLYRPLYWFGVGDTPTLNTSLSMANPPVYSDGNTVATITLKHYMWSNGEQVTAQDLVFWLNMMHAEKANWAAYAPGTIPDNLKSVTATNATTLVVKMTHAVNPYWMTYNQFSQITPMPKAWDVTSLTAAPASGGCYAGAFGAASTDKACTAVYNFLSAQSSDLSTYVGSKIWSVVDGPFVLSAFDSSGDVTMVPNTHYSGPVKASISKFVEVPFTTDSAEFDALVGGTIQVGYVPQQDLPAGTTNPLVAAANNSRLSAYYLNAWYLYGINYFAENFNSTASIGNGGTAGSLFKQLYVRQAIQELVDQKLYIDKYLKGYAVPTYGPVPTLPANPFASSYEKTNPYPYDPSKAISLLKSHGWTVTPGGTDTCSRAGTASNDCGAGIPAGAKFEFNLQYASGTLWITQDMTAEKSSWESAGITVNLSQATFDTVLSNAVPCSGSSCKWTAENWGGGWSFEPDYYPSGEEIFETGAGSNSGSYSDVTNDANIRATNNTNVGLTAYENYLAKELPVVWQPNPAYELTEIANNLRGVTPQNPYGFLSPEDWYFVK
jgi:peptide/nickel transport system substrate-binding protein